MPKGLSQYAIIETGFWRHDPRIRALTPAERCVYLTLWTLAVELRREVIPAAYCTHPHLMYEACVGVPAIISLMKKFKDGTCTLCVVNDNGSITVCGVRDKHKGLKTWNDGVGGQSPPNRPAIAPRLGASEREREQERERRENGGESVRGEPATLRPQPKPKPKPAATPPSTDRGIFLLSLFPNLLDADRLSVRMNENLHPEVSCDDVRFQHEVRRCKVYWETKKGPGHKHNWPNALTNWFGFLKPERNGDRPQRKQLTEAQVEAAFNVTDQP